MSSTHAAACMIGVDLLNLVAKVDTSKYDDSLIALVFEFIGSTSSQCSQQAALWTAEMGDERRGRKKANRHYGWTGQETGSGLSDRFSFY